MFLCKINNLRNSAIQSNEIIFILRQHQLKMHMKSDKEACNCLSDHSLW